MLLFVRAASWEQAIGRGDKAALKEEDLPISPGSVEAIGTAAAEACPPDAAVLAGPVSVKDCFVSLGVVLDTTGADTMMLHRLKQAEKLW